MGMTRPLAGRFVNGFEILASSEERPQQVKRHHAGWISRDRFGTVTYV